MYAYGHIILTIIPFPVGMDDNLHLPLPFTIKLKQTWSAFIFSNALMGDHKVLYIYFLNLFRIETAESIFSC
jgi:hypothetical protein